MLVLSQRKGEKKESIHIKYTWKINWKYLIMYWLITYMFKKVHAGIKMHEEKSLQVLILYSSYKGDWELY